MLDVGRLCIKTSGREAGKLCCIVKKVDATFVMVTGPKILTQVKRRKCNVAHLEPLEDVLAIAADAPDTDVLKAYEKANLLEKFNLRAPTPEEVRKLAEMRAEKEQEKKAREEKIRKEQDELRKKKEELEKKKQSEAQKAKEKAAKDATKKKPEEKKEEKPKLPEEKKEDAKEDKNLKNELHKGTKDSDLKDELKGM